MDLYLIFVSFRHVLFPFRSLGRIWWRGCRGTTAEGWKVGIHQWGMHISPHDDFIISYWFLVSDLLLLWQEKGASVASETYANSSLCYFCIRNVNYIYICAINYNFKFGYLFMHQPAVELVPKLYYKNMQCTGSLFTCPYENRVTVSVFNALLLIFLLTCICMCGRS